MTEKETETKTDSQLYINRTKKNFAVFSQKIQNSGQKKSN